MCHVFRLYLQYQRNSSTFDRQFLVFYMITTLKYDFHVVLFLYQFLKERKFYTFSLLRIVSIY